MPHVTIAEQLDTEEKLLIGDCSAAFGTNMPEFVRETELERIEGELDLKAWEQVKAEFDADPQTISAAQIAERYMSSKRRA